MAMKRRIAGFAKKFVEYLSPILLVDKTSTFVLATNRSGTQFCTIWRLKQLVYSLNKYQGNMKYAVICGSRLNLLEKDVALKVKQSLLKVYPVVYHPAEVELLIGKSVSAKNQLDWKAKTMLVKLNQRIMEAHYRPNNEELSF
jgi:GDP-D-mannose dehydratase